MLKKLKIRGRLIISFSTILFFTIAIAIIALGSLKRSNTNLNEFIDHSYAADTAIKTCRIEANVGARLVREMVLNNDESTYPTYKQKISDAVNNIKKQLTILETVYEKEDGLVAEYKTAFEKWMAIADKTVVEAEKGNNAEATKILLTECSPSLDGLIKLAQQLDKNINTLRQEALENSLKTTNRESLIVLGCLILAVIISITLAFRLSVSIVKPLNEVKQAANDMSRGNLRSAITYESTDELGELADSMRSSTHTLSSYIEDIDGMMAEMAKGNFNIATTQHFIGDFENIEKSISTFVTIMNQTLTQIHSASDQVESSSEQVSISASALAQGATEQAGSVEELSATISDITVQITQTSDNVNQTNQLVDATATEVLSSNEQMKAMINAMADISNASNEISKIIKTIDDIAFQTNILALNAAVEAARAGEAGKGFAVVADEVRNLAQKSAEAASNTTSLIEGSMKAVDNGVQIAHRTADALVVVVEKSQQITGKINEISIASKEEAESAKQIAAGIDQISAVVQTNSATAEESASASLELNGQAQLMKDLVSKFKLMNSNQVSATAAKSSHFVAVSQDNQNNAPSHDFSSGEKY